jgi:hypothetical protein
MLLATAGVVELQLGDADLPSESQKRATGTTLDHGDSASTFPCRGGLAL